MFSSLCVSSNFWCCSSLSFIHRTLAAFGFKMKTKVLLFKNTIEFLFFAVQNFYGFLWSVLFLSFQFLVLFFIIYQRNTIKRNTKSLPASDPFSMFRQLINFYTFYFHILRSTEIWKMWFIKLTGINGLNFFQHFSKVYGKIWVRFCLNPGKRFFLEVSFQSQQKEHRFF